MNILTHFYNSIIRFGNGSKIPRASTCFGGHPNHALLFLPETDVIFKCQEIKQKLKRKEDSNVHLSPVGWQVGTGHR